MSKFAITYQAARRRAAVKVVDAEGAIKELERCLHFAPKTSRAYTDKIRALIDSGKAGDKYEFFDGYIIVIANESAARASGIEAARDAVYRAEMVSSDGDTFLAEKGASLAAIDALKTGATGADTKPEGGE